MSAAADPWGTGDPAELSAAVRDVLDERIRQQVVEHYDADGDDAHDDGDLERAAACYAIGSLVPGLWWDVAGRLLRGPMWPWSVALFKPKDARRNLVRAGALILAAIERLDRRATQDGKGGRP